MSENIKPIPGFEDYFVNIIGQVKSTKKNKVRWLKPYTEKDGYKIVNLYANGKMKAHKVHRLVAQAFIPNPESKPQVNHIDGNKADNRVRNLEWCTVAENKQHSYSTLGVGRIKKVRCVETGIVYESGRAAGRILNIRRESISDVLRGVQKTAGGYHWELA